MKQWFVLILLTLALVACEAESDFQLPTRRATQEIGVVPTLPSGVLLMSNTLLPTWTPTDTPARTPTDTPLASATASPTTSATPSESVIAPRLRVVSVRDILLREGPGLRYPATYSAAYHDEFQILSKAKDDLDSLWYEIVMLDGATAWVYAMKTEFVNPDALANIPFAVQIPPTPNGTSTPNLDDIASLMAYPVLSDISPRMLEVYQAGRSGGRSAGVFAKVGDCHTEEAGFLSPFDSNQFRIALPSDELLATIAYFNGSFSRQSLAAQSGFTVSALLDASWADDEQCRANESPLMCEYRLSNASIALIMIAEHDLDDSMPDAYERYLRRLIEASLAENIIPVLTTSPDPDFGSTVYSNKIVQFNLLMAHLASDYEVPLINLWRAVYAEEDMPNMVEAWIEDGEALPSVENLRNYLTLQMLAKLRLNLG